MKEFEFLPKQTFLEWYETNRIKPGKYFWVIEEDDGLQHQLREPIQNFRPYIARCAINPIYVGVNYYAFSEDTGTETENS